MKTPGCQYICSKAKKEWNGMDFKKAKGTSVVIVLFLFVASFFLGRYAAQVAPVSGRAIQPGADGNWG